MCVAAAIVGGAALVGGVVSAQGAKQGAKAQQAAAETATRQEAASQELAINEQRRQYDTTRADFQPFREAGVNALGRLNAASTGDMSTFTTSPGYGFRRSEGQRDLGSSFAARGGAFSGNALKALTEFNSNLASGEFGNWWNQQTGLVNAGQGATAQVANAGTDASNSISNTLVNTGQSIARNAMIAGDARASGIQGQYNAYGDTLGTVGGLAGSYYANRTPTKMTVKGGNTNVPRYY